MRWFAGPIQNIRDIGMRCLDVYGGRNTHMMHIHFWKCHKGANQAWTVDRKGWNYPKQPLKNGVKFQIRSRMATHKSLFYAEHIGANQFRLRIHWNNPYDAKQWFIFDSRTNTIRANAKRSHCIANQLNTKFRINVATAVRPYRGINQDKIRWYSTSKKNIQNNGKKCLDVHGGSNTDNRHVIFYNCHNGLNQAWWIDQKTKTWPRQPLKDGVRFQLKSRMAGGRALFTAEHIGGQQYRLRIQDNKAFDKNQWFIFDKRTNSIRSDSKRSMAISNQAGQRFLRNRAAVVRKWIGEAMQRSAFYGGSRRNVRNVPGQCLDVHGASNTNRRHVIWWDCHNAANQGWSIDRIGIVYKNYPLSNGVRFQIKSKMAGNKAVKMHEHIGGYQYRLRIQNNNPYDNKQWWVYDWRTKSIRAAGNQKLAISIQNGGNNWAHNGYAAVAKQFKN
jgi:hypothetical protein